MSGPCGACRTEWRMYMASSILFDKATHNHSSCIQACAGTIPFLNIHVAMKELKIPSYLPQLTQRYVECTTWGTIPQRASKLLWQRYRNVTLDHRLLTQKETILPINNLWLSFPSYNSYIPKCLLHLHLVASQSLQYL